MESEGARIQMGYAEGREHTAQAFNIQLHMAESSLKTAIWCLQTHVSIEYPQPFYAGFSSPPGSPSMDQNDLPMGTAHFSICCSL